MVRRGVEEPQGLSVKKGLRKLREGIAVLVLIALIVAGVVWIGPAVYRSGREWLSGFPDRFTVYRISGTIEDLSEERWRLSLQRYDLMPKGATEDAKRFHNALSRDCVEKSQAIRTLCRAYKALEHRVDDLKGLEHQLNLIMLEEHPARTALPPEAEPFVRPAWYPFLKALTAEPRDKYFMAWTRIYRALRTSAGVPVRRSDLITSCAQDKDPPSCVPVKEQYFRDKNIEIIEDTGL
jgi:hypothetical protein